MELRSDFRTLFVTVQNRKKKNRLPVSLISLLAHSLRDRSMEYSLFRAPTLTVPPTREQMELENCRIHINTTETLVLGDSFVFFESETRFGVKIMSRLTRPVVSLFP